MQIISAEEEQRSRILERGRIRESYGGFKKDAYLWTRPEPKLAMPGAGIGVGQGGNLWTKPFLPPFPLTVTGIALFVWGDAMTHTGNGSVITRIEDLANNDDAFGANITQPVTASNEFFNGHWCAVIEAGGHWEHNGAAVTSVASGVNKPWTIYGSVALITNSVSSVVGWGRSATTTSRWTCSFSRGGATRDMAIVKIRDTGAATTSDGTTTLDATPTTYTFRTDGINVTAALGGVAEVLGSPAQTSGQLTVDRFAVGAQITMGTFTAASRMRVRALAVYNNQPSAGDEAAILEWMANDAYQVGP